MKIILAGEGAVGKTTLINRFVTGSFSDDYKATIGVAISSKNVVLNDTEVNLQIWDIAGQTLFRTFRIKFFAKASGAILVFDITVPNTLDRLHTWIEDIYQVTGEIPLVLLGNKVDLVHLKAVRTDEINGFVEQHSSIGSHYLTSALTGENVEKAFLKLVTLMV
jgi:small GTP-binding protein